MELFSNEIVRDLLRVAITIIVVILVYHLILYMLRETMRRKGAAQSNLSGIRFMLKVFLTMIVGFLLFNVFGVSLEQLLSASTIGGIIIGFATTEVMSQIVAGIYLIISGPFDVGDLVKIDKTEGLVVEIGMGYTKVKKFDDTIVQIPNKKILDSKVKNYTIKMTDELKERQVNLLPSEKVDIQSIKDGKTDFETIKKMKKIMGNLSKYMLEEELTRYVFDIEVDVSIPPGIALKKINAVCDNFTKIFIYRPVVIIEKLSYRATMRFRIYCPNPRMIINHMDNFLDEITMALHGGDKR